MNTILCRIVFLAMLSILNPISGYAQEELPATPKNVSAQQANFPTDISSDGAFTYSVAFEIPKYFGLQPNLGLRYSSQNSVRDPSDAFVGAAWKLSGLSVIDRVSARGGAPHYDLAQDVYRLDGVELLACKDSKATNKWAEPYPAGYTSNIENASCSAGGNMVSLRENYLKITQYGVDSQGDVYFYVWKRDGVRYKYESVGKLRGETRSTSSSTFNPAFRSRWLLTEIRDTQATPNVVTISYFIEDKNSGFAHRPREINYGGYKVKFQYDNSTQPRIAFANGSDHPVVVKKRLRSLLVTDGSTKIRAYRTDYHPLSTSGLTRLKYVRQYGSNYVTDGVTITGGSSLPQHEFTYKSGSVGWSRANYTGSAVHGTMSIADLHQDGKDDILIYPFDSYKSGYVRTDRDDGHYELFLDGSKSHVGGHLTVENGSVSGTHDFKKWSTRTPRLESRDSLFGGANSYTSFLGATSIDRTTNKQYAVRLKYNGAWTRSGGEITSVIVTDIDNSTAIRGSITVSTSHYTQEDSGSSRVYHAPSSYCRSQSFIGNFDEDPETELFFNAKIYDLDDGKITLKSSNTGAPKFCRISFQHAVTDIDGDGIDEILLHSGNRGNNIYAYDRVTKRLSRRTMSPSPFGSVGKHEKLAFGDVNGDGMSDAVFHNQDNGTISVALSKGFQFSPKQVNWGGSVRATGFSEHTSSYSGHRTSIRDINGDGLGDLISHLGFRYGDAKKSYKATVFLSNGTKFIHAKSPYLSINAYLATGDFNGDGMLDLLSQNEGGKPAIHYATHQAPHLLTRVKLPTGGFIDAYYRSSKTQSGCKTVPHRNVVTSIVKHSGKPEERQQTNYSYGQCKYDHNLRKFLGFGTVNQYLPKLAGEAHQPKVVTTYHQEHWGLKGRVKTRRKTFGSTTYSLVQNTWHKTASHHRPLRSQIDEVKKGEYWGNSNLIETRTDHLWTIYNQPRYRVEYGFPGSFDDRITHYKFRSNLAHYIVDKPEWMFVEKGNKPYSTWRDFPNLLRMAYYRYDNETARADYSDGPSHGNLTHVFEWKGDPKGSEARLTRKIAYFSRGTVAWEEDAKGNRTRYTYDQKRFMFPETVTNAAGHVERTTWDQRCQKPLTQTNINNLKTTFYYDVHCRLTRTITPTGHNTYHYYRNLGNTSTQFVETRARSASTESSQMWTATQSYFDGLGREYRSVAVPYGNSVNDTAKAQVTRRGYDARGNVAWESIPGRLSEYASIVPVANAKRSTYSYDAADRLVKTVYPNGSHSTKRYYRPHSSGIYKISGYWPAIEMRDAHCHDGTSVTVCGLKHEYFDSEGRTVAQGQHDINGTDLGLSSGRRWTIFEYDQLGQLMEIRDPIGAKWNYEYDSFGNRTKSVDPGLGTWRLEYDANNLLTKQIDAKNQTIEFTYDNLNRVKTKTVRASGLPTEVVTNTYDHNRSSSYNKGHLTGSFYHKDGVEFEYIALNYTKDGQLRSAGVRNDGTYRYYFNEYWQNGALRRQQLPYQHGDQTRRKWYPEHHYDGLNHPTKFGNYVTGTEYGLWGPTKTTYGSGNEHRERYNANMGWSTEKQVWNVSDNHLYFHSRYTRTVMGRVIRHDATAREYDFDYTYDYAGRLLTAKNFWDGSTANNQTFTYDAGGRMRSNSLVGTYDYSTGKHAPWRITGSKAAAITYDANGNMLTGLDGKVMTYDGENRPISVTHNNRTTKYVYGADGTRRKKIENAGRWNEQVTLYYGPVEVRNYNNKARFPKELVTYPHPDVRFVNDEVSYLHRDQLQSVGLITDKDGNRAKMKYYRPFGEIGSEWTPDPTHPVEHKGFIGERYDMGAGLQYLNARYYDPELALFLQPDWFEVQAPGVGTNRYSYSFNDPVNKMDPSGNSAISRGWDSVFGEGSFDNTFGEGATADTDHTADAFFGNREERSRAMAYSRAENAGYGGNYHDFSTENSVVSLDRIDNRAFRWADKAVVRLLQSCRNCARFEKQLDHVIKNAPQLIGKTISKYQRSSVIKSLVDNGTLRVSKTVERQLKGTRSYIPTQSIIETIRYGTRVKDPLGYSGKFMYRAQAIYRGKSKTLEVLVDEKNAIIQHVLYK